MTTLATVRELADYANWMHELRQMFGLATVAEMEDLDCILRGKDSDLYDSLLAVQVMADGSPSEEDRLQVLKALRDAVELFCKRANLPFGSADAANHIVLVSTCLPGFWKKIGNLFGD